MKERYMKISGTVTEVRMIQENEVFVFVKASSPKKLVGKIIRFWIRKSNNGNSGDSSFDWYKLSIGDEILIKKILYPLKHGSYSFYELHTLSSKVLDAEEL
jgi:hypothetical protein